MKKLIIIINPEVTEVELVHGASNQSSILKDREELNQSIKKFKDLYKDENNVPRPDHWSGWRLKHHEIEFWLDGENRIHERLKYIKENNDWKKILLSP